MLSIDSLRKHKQGILVIGYHPRIVQSILDFDFMCGRADSSVVACVTATRKAGKFFYGPREVLVPCYPSVAAVPHSDRKKVQWMFNTRSGRQAFESTIAFFECFPHASGGHIFAENVPERHATELIRRFSGSKLLVGPSLGFLVPGVMKLGPIGGTDPVQLEASKLATPGSVAVISTSGGMTNELIRAVVSAGKRISFALSIGGDRFPVASLTDALMLAQKDPKSHAIVYFGELGGVDEYEMIELLRTKKLTKPVVAYIAGVIDDSFDEHLQFGHAKALVAEKDESASAKRAALRAAGVQVPDTFSEFLEAIVPISQNPFHDRNIDMGIFTNRRSSILSTRSIYAPDDVPVFVKDKMLVSESGAFTRVALQALLGQKVKSRITRAFFEDILCNLLDHGGHVSGAVNTMITARAGKDLVSSLAAGILTIGPRFGGVVNASAEQWLTGVLSDLSADDFVKDCTRNGALLAGIGHRKYRVGIPDPRVAEFSRFADLLKRHPYYDFARSVEKITTSKHGSLILNVDGVMAALMLDILRECEKFSENDLRDLISTEFFNALFVIPRTVGLTAHFMEQKRNDEGLFRLPDDLLFTQD